MSSFSQIEDYIEKWSLDGRLPFGADPDSDESFNDIFQQINFMSEHAYSKFIPAMYSNHSPVFKDRLVKWLNNSNLTEDDQVALLQLILRLAYYSFDDFISLYRTAYSNPIARWVWDQIGLKIDDKAYLSILASEQSKHTWYASVTDSFIISEFYHANSISEIESRPNFATLRELCSPEKINDYMTQPSHSPLRRRLRR